MESRLGHTGSESGKNACGPEFFFCFFFLLLFLFIRRVERLTRLPNARLSLASGL